MLDFNDKSPIKPRLVNCVEGYKIRVTLPKFIVVKIIPELKAVI